MEMKEIERILTKLEIPNLVKKDNNSYYVGDLRLITDFDTYGYSHDISRCFRKIKDSGIEIETQDALTSVLVYSISKKMGIWTCAEEDASLPDYGFEFKMRIADWIRILRYLEETNLVRYMNIASTHVHVSDPAIIVNMIIAYENNYAVPAESLAQQVFGRAYHERYAQDQITMYEKNRYGAFTVPNYRDIENGIAVVSERTTVEFRLPRLTSLALVKRFCRFLGGIKLGLDLEDSAKFACGQLDKQVVYKIVVESIRRKRSEALIIDDDQSYEEEEYQDQDQDNVQIDVDQSEQADPFYESTDPLRNLDSIYSLGYRTSRDLDALDLFVDEIIYVNSIAVESMFDVVTFNSTTATGLRLSYHNSFNINEQLSYGVAVVENQQYLARLRYDSRRANVELLAKIPCGILVSEWAAVGIEKYRSLCEFFKYAQGLRKLDNSNYASDNRACIDVNGSGVGFGIAELRWENKILVCRAAIDSQLLSIQTVEVVIEI